MCDLNLSDIVDWLWLSCINHEIWAQIDMITLSHILEGRPKCVYFLEVYQFTLLIWHLNCLRGHVTKGTAEASTWFHELKMQRSWRFSPFTEWALSLSTSPVSNRGSHWWHRWLQCYLILSLLMHHDSGMVRSRFEYLIVACTHMNTLSPAWWQVHVTNRTAEASTWLHEQSDVLGPFRGGPTSFSHDVASCTHEIVFQLYDSNVILSHMLYWKGISFTLSLIDTPVVIDIKMSIGNSLCMQRDQGRP